MLSNSLIINTLNLKYYYLMLPRHRATCFTAKEERTVENSKGFKEVYKDGTRFERDKMEIIREILAYIPQQQFGSRPTEKEKAADIAIGHRQSATTGNKMISSKQMEVGRVPARGRQIANQSMKGESKAMRLNQYFQEMKATNLEKAPLYNLELINSDSEEEYEILDKFIRKTINNSIYKVRAESSNIDRDNNSKSATCGKANGTTNNESTMMLSNFYRSQISPYQRMRKTELSNHSRRSNQINVEEGITASNPRQQSQEEDICAKDNGTRIEDKIQGQEMHGKETMKEEPEGWFNRYKGSSGPRSTQISANFSYQTSNKNNSKIAQEQLQKNKRQKRQIGILSFNRFDHSHQNQKSLAERVKLKVIQQIQPGSRVYNYDQQSNIFSRFAEKKQVNSQQLKEEFKDVRQIFKIKKEVNSKDRIAYEDLKNNRKKIVLSKKPKNDLFEGCPQLSYRKHFSRMQAQPVKQQKTQSSKVDSSDSSDSSDQISDQKGKSHLKLHFHEKTKINKIDDKLSKQKQALKNGQNIERLYKDRLYEKISEKISNKCEDKKEKKSIVKKSPLNYGVSKDYQSNYTEIKPQEQSLRQQITKETNNRINTFASATLKAVPPNIQNIQKVIINQAEACEPTSQQEKRNQSNSTKNLGNKEFNEELDAKTGQNKPKSIFKIFGQPKNSEKQQNNESIDFFERLNGDLGSNPSTVKQITYKSDDQSQMMKQVKDIQSYQIDSQVFKKDTSSIISQHVLNEVNKPQSIQQKDCKDPSKLDKSYEAIYASIGQLRPEKMNVVELKEINLSQDAISFSKLADAAEQSHRSSLLQISLDQESNIGQQQVGQEIKSVAVQSGKVKRVEIQLDSDSSSSNSLIESKPLSKDGNEVDLDDLSDYDSDQQLQKSNLKVKRVKQVFPRQLTPVYQQDIEQSLYRKIDSFKRQSLNSKST